jgi:hypothetical protein
MHSIALPATPAKHTLPDACSNLLLLFSPYTTSLIQVTTVICLVCKHVKTELAMAYVRGSAVPVAIQ